MERWREWDYKGEGKKTGQVTTPQIDYRTSLLHNTPRHKHTSLITPNTPPLHYTSHYTQSKEPFLHDQFPSTVVKYASNPKPDFIYFLIWYGVTKSPFFLSLYKFAVGHHTLTDHMHYQQEPPKKSTFYLQTYSHNLLSSTTLSH